MPFSKIRNWYAKYERPISSLSLIGGFVFDALTLKRVDMFWENLWVIGHILIVSVAMILVHSIEGEEGAEKNPSKAHFWLVNIIQFFFGGILSTYLVFYFRASDIAASWPFLLILAICFWANESLKRQFVRLSFQVSLLFLSFYCFAIFILPVLFHKIGWQIFVFSGLVSVMAIALFLLLLKQVANKKFKEGQKLSYIIIASIFFAVNLLYYFNFIPPLPLSVNDAGVYYSVRKNGNNYIAKAPEKNSSYFQIYPDIYRTQNQPIYVYTAVFSPPEFKMNILHEWQHYNDQNKKWETISLLKLSVVGGRDNGFRTYSLKSNPVAGKWRVNVETEGGQVIDRIRFNVVLVDTLVQTMEVVK